MKLGKRKKRKKERELLIVFFFFFFFSVYVSARTVIDHWGEKKIEMEINNTGSTYGAAFRQKPIFFHVWKGNSGIF